MDQFDVIANQPIVIDNVRLILLHIWGTLKTVFKLPLYRVFYLQIGGGYLTLSTKVMIHLLSIYFCWSQGSGVIKAGFAGDQIPKYHFPNL